MGSGTYQEVTECCEAFPEVRGGIGQSYDTCPKCGMGSWPHGVRTKMQYWPSDYEKELERRIAALEAKIERLEEHQKEEA